LLNSVNLEEGDGEGTRLDGFLTLAAEFGCAVVATCIDEEGSGADGRVEGPRGPGDHRPRRQSLRLDAHDIFIDTLALPLSTGMVESRRDGIETLEAIKRIKAELPGVRTILGLSNISFGLNPRPAQVLNSVFLHEAAKPASMPPSCTRRRFSPCTASMTRRARSASTSSTTGETMSTIRSRCCSDSTKECRRRAR